MSNKIWDDKTTDLNLNGPEMSFTSDASQNVTNIAPNGQTGRGTDPTSVIFSGVAVCSFDSGATTTGTVNYQWYDASTNQALGVSTQYSGQNTNTLTWNYGLSNEDNGKNFYLQADFTPTPLPSGTTADPLNEPIQVFRGNFKCSSRVGNRNCTFISNCSCRHKCIFQLYWSH